MQYTTKELFTTCELRCRYTSRIAARKLCMFVGCTLYCLYLVVGHASAEEAEEDTYHRISRVIILYMLVDCWIVMLCAYMNA